MSSAPRFFFIFYFFILNTKHRKNKFKDHENKNRRTGVEKIKTRVKWNA